MDSKEIAFRPKARIMRTLGQELISSETVAIIELVKNAFDADATDVTIKFWGELIKGNGGVEIIDNGHGMSLDVIEKAWMEPATDNKKKTPRSPKFKRRLLGEKGVGRFAASRIASELELITRTENSNHETYALFDWRQFDDTNKYLDQILILAENRAPEEISNTDLTKNTHGTVLRMTSLNKTWEKSDFEELQRGLSRLVSPFDTESNFKIRILLPDNFSEFSKEITPPAVIKYPHYSVKGNVDANGKFTIELKAYDKGISKTIDSYFIWISSNSDRKFFVVNQTKYDELTSNGDSGVININTGPFKFELRFWDRDELGNVIQKTNSLLSDVRKDLDSVAGINIYRDNFRVLPYGEPNDDWLRLDLRRVQQPTKKLSNNQILGFINITADENPNLKDQSNREGLDENQAYEDLRNIMFYLLNEVENLRYDLRPRRSNEVNYSTPLRGLFNSISLVELDEKIKKQYPEDFELQKLLGETQKELQGQIEEIQTVISRYQNLAVLGSLIDVVLHDGRHPLNKIVKESFLGKEEIEAYEPNEFLQKLSNRFQIIETQGKHLSNVFKRIEPFGGRRRGKPAKFYLEEIIKDAINVLESEINRLKVKINLSQSETLVRVDPSEIQQVIINLLDNSLYWLEIEPQNAREIYIEVRRIEEDNVQIIFSDSGSGINPENRSKIFEPYFSTKPNGVGLGLAIAGEIISDFYNGTFELIENGPLKGATFIITLRKRL